MSGLKPMSGETLDLTKENINKLKELFPEVLTEDQIDFEKLRLILGDDVNDKPEKYSFSWNGKKDAIKLAQRPSTGTLKPNKESSKEWDTTENLYIEGDNLEVLKLLQKSYANKINMIYIDPPYNTGNDIIYKNDFTDSIKYYKAYTGQTDSEGYTFSTNNESDGKFHTNWLNLMYPRLKLAKSLLADDGIINISIDEYEMHNLRKICDEIFGYSNYIGTIITRCNPQGRGKKNVDPVHEYNFLYAKDINNIEELKIKRDNSNMSYNYLRRSGTNSRKMERPQRFYPLLVKDNKVSSITQEEYEKIYEEGIFNEDHIRKINRNYEKKGFKVIYPVASDGEEKVWQRQFSRVQKECHTYIYEKGQIKTPSLPFRTPPSLWLDEKYSNSGSGTNVLIDLFDGLKPFDFPKSYKTVKDFISLNYNETHEDFGKKPYIVLDFFSGSATTAHAVMDLNAEDGGNRNFIMVQLPENLLDVYKNSDKDRKKEIKAVIDKLELKNKKLDLCEIGKERVRRSGDKVMKDNNLIQGELDTGFKVFELDTSNIQKWNVNSKNLEESLFAMENNFVEGRSNLDIVYEILLKLGLDLNTPFEESTIEGSTVYDVALGNVYVVLGNNITQEVANYIAGKQKEFENENPSVVFNDNGFKNDNEKLNAIEILKNNGFNEEQLMSI